MLRDITLGQYYPVDSVLHRMDPRTKLFGTMVFIISLFVADSIWAYLVATLFLAMAIRLSHVPFKFMVRGLKAIIFLLLISVSFNLFLTPGEVVFRLWFLRVTKEGLMTAGFLIYLFLFCSFLKNNLSLNSSSPANDFSFSFLMFS